MVTGETPRAIESAATPKAVIVLPALPVTDVGKPYKLALRADATEREVRAALAPYPGVRTIATSIDDGTPLTTVGVDPTSDRSAIESALGVYAIEWKVVAS